MWNLCLKLTYSRFILEICKFAMKSRFFILFTFLMLLSSNLFAAISKNEKDFIKGSLSDKISIINKLDKKEFVPVVLKGLDFSIENVTVLENDTQLTELATACVRVLPSEPEEINNIPPADQRNISEKIMAIFKFFKDPSLRRAIMEKLEFYAGNDKELTVHFLNDYLSNAFKRNLDESKVHEGAIVTLGRIGNDESLSIIYNIWVSKIWPSYQKTTDEALVALSQDSFANVIRIMSASSIEDSAHYFSLFYKSEKISEIFLCQVAENALLIAINNVENLSAKKGAENAFVSFLIESHEILTEHKWSHAAPVINNAVLLAKKAYDGGTMKEKDFVRIIESSVKIPSPNLAQSLTDMLSECNGKVEKASQGENEMPAKSVVLALISSLGELGDKTAFDALLYVTYLSYPLDVIDEAKKSLAALNW